MADAERIEAAHVFIPQIQELPAAAATPPTNNLRLSDAEEKELLYRALEKNLWIKKDAARDLGLTPRAKLPHQKAWYYPPALAQKQIKSVLKMHLTPKGFVARDKRITHLFF